MNIITIAEARKAAVGAILSYPIISIPEAVIKPVNIGNPDAGML